VAGKEEQKGTVKNTLGGTVDCMGFVGGTIKYRHQNKWYNYIDTRGGLYFGIKDFGIGISRIEGR